MHLSCFSGLTALALAASVGAIPADSGVPNNSTGGKLSDALLAVGSELSKTQPSGDVAPVVVNIKQNSAAIDQASAQTGITAAQKAAKACAIIKTLFPSEYTDSYSPNYVTEVEEPRVSTVWQNSTCFFTPNNTADVAFGLKIVTSTSSPFSTRGGGHSQNDGFNSIKDGLVIDMSAINYTQLSSDQSYVTIGAGNRWGATYDALAPYGKAVVGGRAYDVGTGLILGVGIPFLSSTYGFACDNIRRFEIVLPNSTVINATQTQNSDLFTAQKGGGPNYGIVTEWELYTIPNEIWYTAGYYNYSDIKAIIPAITQVQANMENDSNAGIIFAAAGSQILIGFFYAHYTTPPAVFAPFDNIQASQYLAQNVNGTIANASATVSPGSADRVQYYSRAMAHEAKLETYEQAFAAFDAIKNFNPGSANDVMQFGIQGITAAAVQAGQRRGGNWLGMKQVSTNWWHAVTSWTEHDSTIAAKARSSTIDMYNNITAITKQQGTYLDFVFANDAASDQPSPLAGYGADNVNKMKAVAKKYDPAEIMQNLQGGGFKLSLV